MWKLKANFRSEAFTHDCMLLVRHEGIYNPCDGRFMVEINSLKLAIFFEIMFDEIQQKKAYKTPLVVRIFYSSQD